MADRRGGPVGRPLFDASAASSSGEGAGGPWAGASQEAGLGSPGMPVPSAGLVSLPGASGPGTSTSLPGAGLSSAAMLAAAAQAAVSVPMPVGLGPGGRPLAAFLKSLYDMVSEGGPNAKWVHWARDGTTFIITDVDGFSTHILPRYYRHSNFSSFSRQLNFYSFKKVQDEDEEGGYLAVAQAQGAAVVGAGAGAGSSGRPPAPRPSGGNKAPTTLEYRHKYFIRGRPDLLHRVVRKTNATAIKELAAEEKQDKLRRKREQQLLAALGLGGAGGGQAADGAPGSSPVPTKAKVPIGSASNADPSARGDGSSVGSGSVGGAPPPPPGVSPVTAALTAAGVDPVTAALVASTLGIGSLSTETLAAVAASARFGSGGGGSSSSTPATSLAPVPSSLHGLTGLGRADGGLGAGSGHLGSAMGGLQGLGMSLGLGPIHQLGSNGPGLLEDTGPGLTSGLLQGGRNLPLGMGIPMGLGMGTGHGAMGMGMGLGPMGLGSRQGQGLSGYLSGYGQGLGLGLGGHQGLSGGNGVFGPSSGLVAPLASPTGLQADEHVGLPEHLRDAGNSTHTGVLGSTTKAGSGSMLSLPGAVGGDDHGHGSDQGDDSDGDSGRGSPQPHKLRSGAMGTRTASKGRQAASPAHSTGIGLAGHQPVFVFVPPPPSQSQPAGQATGQTAASAGHGTESGRNPLAVAIQQASVNNSGGMMLECGSTSTGATGKAAALLSMLPTTGVASQANAQPQQPGQDSRPAWASSPASTGTAGSLSLSTSTGTGPRSTSLAAPVPMPTTIPLDNVHVALEAFKTGRISSAHMMEALRTCASRDPKLATSIASTLPPPLQVAFVLHLGQLTQAQQGQGQQTVPGLLARSAASATSLSSAGGNARDKSGLVPAAFGAGLAAVASANSPSSAVGKPLGQLGINTGGINSAIASAMRPSQATATSNPFEPYPHGRSDTGPAITGASAAPIPNTGLGPSVTDSSVVATGGRPSPLAAALGQSMGLGLGLGHACAGTGAGSSGPFSSGALGLPGLLLGSIGKGLGHHHSISAPLPSSDRFPGLFNNHAPAGATIGAFSRAPVREAASFELAFDGQEHDQPHGHRNGVPGLQPAFGLPQGLPGAFKSPFGLGGHHGAGDDDGLGGVASTHSPMLAYSALRAPDSPLGALFATGRAGNGIAQAGPPAHRPVGPTSSFMGGQGLSPLAGKPGGLSPSGGHGQGMHMPSQAAAVASPFGPMLTSPSHAVSAHDHTQAPAPSANHSTAASKPRATGGPRIGWPTSSRPPGGSEHGDAAPALSTGAAVPSEAQPQAEPLPNAHAGSAVGASPTQDGAQHVSQPPAKAKMATERAPAPTAGQAAVGTKQPRHGSNKGHTPASAGAAGDAHAGAGGQPSKRRRT